MTRRVLAGKSLPGELYPHGLGDLHWLDFRSTDEAVRLAVRCFEVSGEVCQKLRTKYRN
jgi:hypothetical protein